MKQLKLLMITILTILLLGMNCRVMPLEYQLPTDEQFTNKMAVHSQNPTQKVVKTQAYIERGPITITSDFQLNNSGFAGNGTIDDPIRIENFNSTDPSDTLVGLIDIRSTTYYFSIVNCLINGSCSWLECSTLTFYLISHVTTEPA